MDNNRVKKIMVTVLQNTLVGNLKPESNVNPQRLAEALVTLIDFQKPYNEIRNEKFVEAFTKTLISAKVETTGELEKLTQEEKMLANFIRGKLTAYAEMIDALNNIK